MIYTQQNETTKCQLKNIFWFRINLIVRLNLLKFEMTKTTAMLQFMVIFIGDSTRKEFMRNNYLYNAVNTIVVA